MPYTEKLCPKVVPSSGFRHITVYYINDGKYSPNSYVANFPTQISSSQSEERTMVFTGRKNDTSNQNRERCFFTCEKNDTSNLKPQRCVSFAPKFPFIAACSAASHTCNEKSFTQRVCLAKKVKNISEIEWNSFVCFTVDKKTVESRRNNSGKGKTERDVSFCSAFSRSYFAFYLSLSLNWNRPFYLNSLTFNCVLRTNS